SRRSYQVKSARSATGWRASVRFMLVTRPPCDRIASRAARDEGFSAASASERGAMRDMVVSSSRTVRPNVLPILPRPARALSRSTMERVASWPDSPQEHLATSRPRTREDERLSSELSLKDLSIRYGRGGTPARGVAVVVRAETARRGRGRCFVDVSLRRRVSPPRQLDMRDLPRTSLDQLHGAIQMSALGIPFPADRSLQPGPGPARPDRPGLPGRREGMPDRSQGAERAADFHPRPGAQGTALGIHGRAGTEAAGRRPGPPRRPGSFLPSQGKPSPSLTGNRWNAPRELSERSQRIPLAQVTRSRAQPASVSPQPFCPASQRESSDPGAAA